MNEGVTATNFKCPFCGETFEAEEGKYNICSQLACVGKLMQQITRKNRHPEYNELWTELTQRFRWLPQPTPSATSSSVDLTGKTNEQTPSATSSSVDLTGRTNEQTPSATSSSVELTGGTNEQTPSASSSSVDPTGGTNEQTPSANLSCEGTNETNGQTLSVQWEYVDQKTDKRVCTVVNLPGWVYDTVTGTFCYAAGHNSRGMVKLQSGKERSKEHLRAVTGEELKRIRVFNIPGWLYDSVSDELCVATVQDSRGMVKLQNGNERSKEHLRSLTREELKQVEVIEAKCSENVNAIVAEKRREAVPNIQDEKPKKRRLQQIVQQLGPEMSPTHKRLRKRAKR